MSHNEGFVSKLEGLVQGTLNSLRSVTLHSFHTLCAQALNDTISIANTR